MLGALVCKLQMLLKSRVVKNTFIEFYIYINIIHLKFLLSRYVKFDRHFFPLFQWWSNIGVHEWVGCGAQDVSLLTLDASWPPLFSNHPLIVMYLACQNLRCNNSHKTKQTNKTIKSFSYHVLDLFTLSFCHSPDQIRFCKGSRDFLNTRNTPFFCRICLACFLRRSSTREINLTHSESYNFPEKSLFITSFNCPSKVYQAVWYDWFHFESFSSIEKDLKKKKTLNLCEVLLSVFVYSSYYVFLSKYLSVFCKVVVHDKWKPCQPAYSFMFRFISCCIVHSPTAVAFKRECFWFEATVSVHVQVLSAVAWGVCNVSTFMNMNWVVALHVYQLA